MGRYYYFSKVISEEQSSKIIGELEKMDNVKNVQVTPEHTSLLIETRNNEFSEVMGKTVNVCSKIAGVEISFEKFAFRTI